MGNGRSRSFAVGGFARDTDIAQLIIRQFEQVKARVPEFTVP
jgi:hypothetical protein